MHFDADLPLDEAERQAEACCRKLFDDMLGAKERH